MLSVVLLLNLLIAMMSHSYERVMEAADATCAAKFAAMVSRLELAMPACRRARADARLRAALAVEAVDKDGATHRPMLREALSKQDTAEFKQLAAAAALTLDAELIDDDDDDDRDTEIKTPEPALELESAAEAVEHAAEDLADELASNLMGALETAEHMVPLIDPGPGPSTASGGSDVDDDARPPARTEGGGSSPTAFLY